LEQSPTRGGHERKIWTSRRAIAAHVTLAIWFPGCIVATWWQVNVALSGDDLGWAYSVMWPCFAVFGAVFWWFLVHDDPETVGSKGLRRLQRAAAEGPSDRSAESSSGEDELTRTPSCDDMIRYAEEEDPELAAYNRYLADLAHRDPPKTWTGR